MRHDEKSNAILDWAKRNTWIPGSRDEFVVLCLKQLDKGLPDLTPGEAHQICIQTASALLYRLCASSNNQNRIRGYESLGQYLVKVGLGMAPDAATDEILAESVQSSLLAIHKSLDRVQTPLVFIGYCQVVLRHELFRRIKRSNKERDQEISFDEVINPDDGEDGLTRGEVIFLEDDLIPDEIIAEIDQQNGLWLCLAATKLASKSKASLYMLYKLNFTIQEIANKFESTRQAIDTALSRAKEKLRNDQGFVSCLRSLEYSI